MDKIFRFLANTGKLKESHRRGWLLHEIEDSETTASHIFHLAVLIWIIGKKKKNIDIDRAIKMALVHDMCEVFSPDLTSYDAAAIDESKEVTEEYIKNLVPKKGRPTPLQRKKMNDIKKKLEDKAIKKLVEDLDDDMKKEVLELWEEHEKGVTPESRLVRQGDKFINLYQGFEYYKKYGKIEYELWIRRAKEVIDDPHFVKLLDELEKEELKK